MTSIHCSCYKTNSLCHPGVCCVFVICVHFREGGDDVEMKTNDKDDIEKQNTEEEPETLTDPFTKTKSGYENRTRSFSTL